MRMYPDKWRVRLITGVVATACLAAALKLGPAMGFNWFWPLMLLVVVAIIVGNLIGLQVYRLLFGPPSAGPTNKDKQG